MPSSVPSKIISEATRRLPAELKGRHPGIDWVAVTAAGQRLPGNEYEGVDENLIWHTVRHDLGELRAVAAAELEQQPELHQNLDY